MNLIEALALSERGSAWCQLSHIDSSINGVFHAMRGTDGAVFVGEGGLDSRARLRTLQPIESYPKSIRQIFTHYDKWEPKFPMHPLEALARADAPLTIDNIFHTLWAKAAKAPDYDEIEWMTLRRFLEDHNSSATLLASYQD